MYIYFKVHSDYYCYVSFDGEVWYTLKKESIWPTSWLDKLLYILEHTENEIIYSEGRYDKATKILHLEYNKKLSRLYKLIIRLQSLTKTGQSFLVDDKKRVEMLKLPIDVKLVAFKEPVVGQEYKINKAEEDTRQFKDESTGEVRSVGCIIVDYEPIKREENDNTRYRSTLWIPDNKEVAPSGKLGSHLAAFAEYFGEEPEALVKTLEPKLWEGKMVEILQWSSKTRAIKVRG